jgi:hypothetical protein
LLPHHSYEGGTKFISRCMDGYWWGWRLQFFTCWSQKLIDRFGIHMGSCDGMDGDTRTTRLDTSTASVPWEWRQKACWHSLTSHQVYIIGNSARKLVGTY